MAAQQEHVDQPVFEWIVLFSQNFSVKSIHHSLLKVEFGKCPQIIHRIRYSLKIDAYYSYAIKSDALMLKFWKYYCYLTNNKSKFEE